MWRTFKRPLYSAASWRVSPILHLSLSFYFDTQFIYAFLFFSRRHTNKADMRSFTTTVAALASVVPAVMSLTINTPSSVVQCQPQLIGWNDGTPPYYPSIIPGGQPSAAAIQTFDMQTGNSITWKANQPAGTRMTFSVKDSTGTIAYSDIVTVQQGPDSSCLGSSGVQPQPAASPAAQDVTDSVNASNVPTSGVSTPLSSSAVVVQTGTIRPASSVSGVTASRAASVASGSSSATQSVSRTSSTARAAATSSSGAEPSLIGHGYGLIGAVGLIGALFL